MAEDFKPWDVKVVRISLGGEDDADGWLEAEVFDDKELRISFNGANIGDCQIGVTSATVEEMSIDVARRLRDFLNYAVPNGPSNRPAACGRSRLSDGLAGKT